MKADIITIIDVFILLLAHILPIYFVVKRRSWCIVKGTLTAWVLLIGQGYFLGAMDPYRDVHVLDSFWLLFGWLWGLMFSLSVFGIASIVRHFRTHEKKM